jgi:hypothetical protein
MALDNINARDIANFEVNKLNVSSDLGVDVLLGRDLIQQTIFNFI